MTAPMRHRARRTGQITTLLSILATVLLFVAWLIFSHNATKPLGWSDPFSWMAAGLVVLALSRVTERFGY